MKKVITVLVACFAMFATIAIVHAQSIIKQSAKIDQIKQFLNSNSLEIIENYNEDQISVYKVHDLDKDQFYKVAFNGNQEIGWYDDIAYGDFKKVADELTNVMKDKSNKDTIPVMVEMIFDYSSINSELSKKESAYFNNVGIKESLSTEQIDTAKAKKLNYVKTKMSEINVVPKEYQVNYVSEYSPFMFLNLTKDQINELKNDDRVYAISYAPDQKFVLFDRKGVAEALGDIMNNPITSTRTNVVKNAGKNGSGVKIGQIELGLPNPNSDALSGKSITLRDVNCDADVSSAIHAEEVAGVLIGSNGVAPSAHLYSACALNSNNFPAAIDWLVSQGVDVINISMGYPNSPYSQTDRYMDAISYMNDILIVSAAGNDASPASSNSVGSVALSYNGITVGNIDYQGTSYADAMNAYRHNTSYYNLYGYGKVSNKPDMVAPGEEVNYTGAYPNYYGRNAGGNSFSAPLVAGASALLMQQSSTAKNNFLVLKAALYATARPMNHYGKYVTYNVDGFPTNFESINNEIGLGILDTKAASDLLSWNQYRSFTVSGGYMNEYVYNNTLGNGMDVRVAITWAKPNTATSYNNITYGSDRVADLDLWILGPNNEKVMKSSSDYDNIEWVHFVTSNGYGQYKFKVVNYNTHSNSVPTKVAMAWW